MNQLRRIRIKLGITQAELSKRTKIIYSTVSRIDTGVLKPSAQHKRKIAKALRCKIQDIFPAEVPIKKDFPK